MAVDSRRVGLLRTYADVVSFLLQTNVTDEVTAKSFSNVVSLRQNPAMVKETHVRMLLCKAL